MGFFFCLFVFCRTTEEQNLVAYIDNGKLFFCTSREIPPEQELLFYYSREYSRQLGKTASWSLSTQFSSHLQPWLLGNVALKKSQQELQQELCVALR